jgi:mannose-6-phosphate isomerase-like protein (cupin superfamily)
MAPMVSDYEVVEIGSPEQWRDHFGGFDDTRSRQGRRIVDHELTMQYIGLSVNALAPGEEAGYWHRHAQIEELYVFLSGQGEMGLDDDLVPVSSGTVVRVGQEVLRTWRALPESDGELRWLCIRAGGAPLPHLPDDSSRDADRPMPWVDPQPPLL